MHTKRRHHIQQSQHAKHEEEVFFCGESYFTALLKDINNATTSIDLETYIFELDSLGKRVMQALLEAAQRGVAVRVLVDGAGTPQWGGKIVRTLEKSGGETRVFHPFPWHLWQWSRSFIHVPSILKAVYLLLKINSRNHRKTCIIDKKIAYIGGFNIAKNHVTDPATIQHADKNKEKAEDAKLCEVNLRDEDKDKDRNKDKARTAHGNGTIGWRDTGIRISATSLNELCLAFNAAWDHLTTNERLRHIFRHVYTNPIFRLNYGRHRRRVLYKNLLHRIAACKQRIWITNAYFVPDNFLLHRLQDAAMRGVDVRILLPQESDIAFMPWASKSFYERLLKAGARIFEYLPTVLHAKTLILDEWMLIGSSNLNHRSLLHDLEIDVNIRLATSKMALEQQFQKDLRQAKEITLQTWHKPVFYQRFIGWISLYLKYWI